MEKVENNGSPPLPSAPAPWEWFAEKESKGVPHIAASECKPQAPSETPSEQVFAPNTAEAKQVDLTDESLTCQTINNGSDEEKSSPTAPTTTNTITPTEQWMRALHPLGLHQRLTQLQRFNELPLEEVLIYGCEVTYRPKNVFKRAGISIMNKVFKNGLQRTVNFDSPGRLTETHELYSIEQTTWKLFGYAFGSCGESGTQIYNSELFQHFRVGTIYSELARKIFAHRDLLTRSAINRDGSIRQQIHGKIATLMEADVDGALYLLNPEYFENTVSHINNLIALRSMRRLADDITPGNKKLDFRGMARTGKARPVARRIALA
jgi:hypothetical protein